MKPIIESLLLAAVEPLKLELLADLLECAKPQVREAMTALMADYDRPDRGIRIVEVAGGYQFRTPEAHADWVRRLNAGRPFKFSRAALETLSIIAYRQPVTRADIEYLRGVDSGGVVRTLLEKHLIRILGKKDVPGRPIIYGTSAQFLELFGLKDLAGLPPLKEVGALDEEMTPSVLHEQELRESE